MEIIEKKENWYDRFRSFCMSRMVPSEELEEDGLIYWRAYILFSILFAVFVSGLVTLIPVFILVIKNNLWGLGIFDFGAWLTIIMLLLARNISFETRSAITLILTYLLGMVIIVNVGILSGGPLCLFGFAVFAGIFRGTRAVSFALALNAITLFILSWLISTGRFGQTFPFFKTPEAMLAALATFMLLNIAVAISVRVLVKGLSKTNQKQKDLLIDLKIEKARLENTKIKLESEVEKHRKSENALRESEERYRDLVENATDLIFIHDLKGKLLSINSAFARAIGLEDKELGELCVPDIMPQDMRPEFKNYLKDIQRDGKADGIMKIVTRKGEKRFWEYRNTMRTEGVYEPVVRGMARDVTGAILAKRALKESEARYRNLFENNLAVMLIIDPDNGAIVDANPAACSYYGWSHEELKKMRIGDINTLTEKKVFEEMQLASSGRRNHFFFKHRRADGTVRDVEVYNGPLKFKGKVMLYSTIYDITDRKRIEDELLKADKLESVGILAGGIAHDFNNILTAILGNISMAKMQVKPGNNMFDLLSAAEKASMRARGLTMQLLTFAKGGKPVRETSSIQELIRESSLFVLQGSKSECEFQIAEDLWAVDADEGQISQVISNIVINANQAMPEGGIVRITAENLMPEKIYELHVNPGRYIRISISDNGAGIAENHLSKIFDPYFTTKKEGSGLGLAAAYSIIKKHNGHISVDSLPGAGTTFYIYLPASDRAVTAKEEADLITGRGRILVMDDDGVLRHMAEAMLELLGYESGLAEDGAKAIEIYRKAMESGKPYDAVIMDLTIPGGMGGKEVVKILLEMDPEVKAIVFSGYSESPVLANHLKHGFKGKIAKPFDLNTLGKVLNEVLKEPKI